MDEKKGLSDNQPQMAANYGQMQVYHPDDEIDLRELWQTLKRRKHIVFITVVLFLAAARYFDNADNLKRYQIFKTVWLACGCRSLIFVRE